MRGFPVRGILIVSLVLSAVQARAQDGDGFLFKAPRGALSVRAGFDHATAGSDLFSFTTGQLTVDQGDFSSPTIVVDVDYTIMPRLDVRFGFGFARSKMPSEFRNFVDN